MTEFARQFIKTFVRFGAAIREKDFAWTGQIDELLCEPSLRFGVVEIRNVNELLRLLGQSLGNVGVGMSKGANPDSTRQIEVTSSIHIPQVAARAVVEYQFKAAVRGNDILL